MVSITRKRYNPHHKNYRGKRSKELDPWDIIPTKDITSCSVCGRQIWKYWYQKKVRGKDGGTFNKHPGMTVCGPHFFNAQNS